MTLWTVVCQAPLSVRFSRQDYWSGMPCSSPGDLPNAGIEPISPASPALQVTAEPVGKPRRESISSVTQSCPTLCDPMNHSTPGLLVHHQFPEFTQTHVHRVGDAIQPSHPLSPASPPAPSPSQHNRVFSNESTAHEVAKVLEFQL